MKKILKALLTGFENDLGSVLNIFDSIIGENMLQDERCNSIDYLKGTLVTISVKSMLIRILPDLSLDQSIGYARLLKREKRSHKWLGSKCSHHKDLFHSFEFKNRLVSPFIHVFWNNSVEMEICMLDILEADASFFTDLLDCFFAYEKKCHLWYFNGLLDRIG